MRGSEQDTASGLADADEVAGGRSGHDAVLADEELLHAICGTDLCNDLGDLGVVEAAITTDDEGGALSTLGDGVEDGGNEVLGVVGLLEDLDLLAEAGAVREGGVSRLFGTVGGVMGGVWWGIDLRSRLLVLEGLGLDSLDAHDCNAMCV